jgi:hypothetical protein
MRYTNELKTQILEIFKGDNRIDQVIHFIEKGEHDKLRNLLESLIDDPSLYKTKIVKGEGFLIIRSDKKDEYKRRKNVYDKFMIEYDNHLYSIINKTKNKLIQ